MFSYFLSVAVAFITFGTLFNIARAFKVVNPDDSDSVGFWLLIGMCSLIWFIAVPLIFIALLMFLLKRLVDFISNFILKRVQK